MASDGTQANAPGANYTSIGSFDGVMSGDGRFVAFRSIANNLVPGAPTACCDVYVHDRQTGVTELAGGPGEGRIVISATGRFLASGGPLTFVYDREAKVSEQVSVALSGQPNAYSHPCGVSADGRFVAFDSEASNLVPDDTNANPVGDVFGGDIFVRDRQLGVTERVNVASGGTQANADSSGCAISDDGRFVAFASDATNLVPGDTNGVRDAFVRDRQTGTTTRVGVASGGAEPNNYTFPCAISADGRFVTFVSSASNLVPGDTNGAGDVFVRDQQLGVTERVSVASDGTQGNGNPSACSISADGRFVAFGSSASNLVPGDTNADEADDISGEDIFVRDRQLGVTDRVNVASDGAQANGDSSGCTISDDGRFVAFDSKAANLVAGDTNGGRDVFVQDLAILPTTTTSTMGTSSTTSSTSTTHTTSSTSSTSTSTTGTTIASTTSTSPTISTTSSTSTPPTSSMTSTSMTTSTLTTMTTSTTIPCVSPACLVPGILKAPSCAGETIPKAITSNLTRVSALINQASDTTGGKHNKLVKRARAGLAAVVKAAKKAAKGRNPAVSSPCAAAIQTGAQQARVAL